MGWKWLFGAIKGSRVKKGMSLYNTLGRIKEPFSLPPYVREVRMYNCGPTVYGIQHIGNLSMFVFTDILRRTLEYNGFEVKQVINFTDFGHLTSDQDEGEDKMMKGLAREGLQPTLENMLEMGKKYAGIFKNDLRGLNVNVDAITFPFASEYVPAQIAMIKSLEEKGYAYRTKSGVYFNTSNFPDYGKLGEIDLKGLRSGARIALDPDKKNLTDFTLWKAGTTLGWDSPWGKGFPGWHIECSAMINAILGKQIDIHTGGIEHIPVHHNNEIAQSEAATGKKPLSRFWMHRAHIQMDGAKIAKSEGNVVYLADILQRGFHPIALRYLFLGAHYRTPSNFTWDALTAAQNAFLKLRRLVENHSRTGTAREKWQDNVRDRINDDLDTPGALAALWDMTKDSSLSIEDIRATILDADKVLGLGLSAPDKKAEELATKAFGKAMPLSDVPEKIRAMVGERENARADKNWERADELRGEIENEGYTIEDGGGSPRIFKR